MRRWDDAWVLLSAAIGFLIACVLFAAVGFIAEIPQDGVGRIAWLQAAAASIQTFVLILTLVVAFVAFNRDKASRKADQANAYHAAAVSLDWPFWVLANECLKLQSIALNLGMYFSEVEHQISEDTDFWPKAFLVALSELDAQLQKCSATFESFIHGLPEKERAEAALCIQRLQALKSQEYMRAPGKVIKGQESRYIAADILGGCANECFEVSLSMRRVASVS